MRFAVGPVGARATAEWPAFCRRVEALGYDAVHAGDHLDGRGGPFALLGAAATATERLTLGTYVLAAALRPAPVVVEEAAALDELSGGRFELGLGAGWRLADFEAAGLSLDAGARLHRLGQVVGAVRAALPDLIVAIGAGRPRLLAFAAATADIVSINLALDAAGSGRTHRTGNETATAAKLAVVAEASSSRDDPPQLHVTATTVTVTADPAESERAVVALAAELGVDPEDVRGSPHLLVGTVDELVEELAAREARWGIGYVGIPAAAAEAFAPVVSSLRSG